MLSIDPKSTQTKDLHQYLLGAVAPRPICFASTVDEEGNPNLAPYSFFNVFSSNPPIAIFSSNRRVRDNTTKDTLHNVEATKEVVINVVSHSIVQQMTLTSIEYPTEVSEFDKAGLTPIASDLVKPFRVKESPVQMECKVNNIIALGEHGGAGNLVVCEVVRMHIDEAVLDKEGKIDPQKIDLMGRMGRAFYCRASGEAVSTIVRAVNQLAIGVDALPKQIRLSKVLTGNDLAILGGVLEMPSQETLEQLKKEPRTLELFEEFGNNTTHLNEKIHKLAKDLIRVGEVEKALANLLLLE